VSDETRQPAAESSSPEGARRAASGSSAGATRRGRAASGSSKEATRRGPENSSKDTTALVGVAVAVAVRYLLVAILVLLATLLVYSGTYKLETGQEGLVLRFGKYAYTEKTPGLHFKLPWPVDRVIQVKIGLVRSVTTDLHWPPGLQAEPQDPVPRVVLTGDKNVLECKFGVTYSVTDGQAYHLLVYHDHTTNVHHADLIVDALTCDALVKGMACRDVDGARTALRGRIGMDVLGRVSDDLQLVVGKTMEKKGTLPIGVGVDLSKSPGLSAVQVPADIRSEFEKVLTERIRVRTVESEAIREARRAQAEAGAYCEEKLREAQAKAEAVQRKAEGEVAKFLGWHRLARKYREDENPKTDESLVWQRLYRETIADVFREFEEIVILPKADGKERKRVRIQLLPAPR